MGIVLFLVAFFVAVVAFDITKRVLRSKNWSWFGKWLCSMAVSAVFGFAGFWAAVWAFRTPSGHF